MPIYSSVVFILFAVPVVLIAFGMVSNYLDAHVGVWRTLSQRYPLDPAHNVAAPSQTHADLSAAPPLPEDAHGAPADRPDTKSNTDSARIYILSRARFDKLRHARPTFLGCLGMILFPWIWLYMRWHHGVALFNITYTLTDTLLILARSSSAVALPLAALAPIEPLDTHMGEHIALAIDDHVLMVPTRVYAEELKLRGMIASAHAHNVEP